MRTAVIDVGTNSVRLLVADIEDGTVVDIARELHITRLGEGVDSARALAPEPMRRTVEAVAVYAEKARTLRAEQIRIIATSAVRDAANRDEFADAVRTTAHIDVELLSGEHEARFGFAGATSDLRGGPFLIVDVGGGSTEFVRGRSEPERWISVDIGSVRLSERHIKTDPPLDAEIAALRADARREIARAADVVGDEPAMLVGLAGTITSVAAVALDLQGYDRDAIHHARISIADIRDVRARLASMTSEERRALPAMPRGREDVIVAGIVIFEEIMERFHLQECIVSERDLLDGAALDTSSSRTR